MTTRFGLGEEVFATTWVAVQALMQDQKVAFRTADFHYLLGLTYLRARPHPDLGKASAAFTFAASEGRGTGSVVTQWLSRKTGASAGPRLGRHEAASAAGSTSCPTVAKLYGVSWVIWS